MTRLGIIRHGRTIWNSEGRAQGASDIPLDEEGVSGARKLAERLSGEPWHAVYASQLQRARHTAEIVGERIGVMPVHLDHRLREVGGGQIDGTTEEERVQRWGVNWRALDLGIEPAESVYARAQSILNEIAQMHVNQNVLIVTHGSFIRKLMEMLDPQFHVPEYPKNTSFTLIAQTQVGWKCELYNCIRHMHEIKLYKD